MPEVPGPSLLAVAAPDDAWAPAAGLLEAAARNGGLECLVVEPAAAQRALADAAAAAGGRQGAAGVAIVAFGRAGEAALRLAAETGQATALALIGAPLSEDAVELVADWPELPLFTVAPADDRPALRGAVDAYLASDHRSSDLLVGPVDAEAVGAAVGWLTLRLGQVASVDEVTVTSSDGWELHGTRWLPHRPEPVPGVVLLHSGRSDRAVFARLERLLAERGIAVLNLDWRGRGQSTNRGTYFALPAEERAAGWRDAAAAFEHLAACPEVDGNRLGAVGVVHGAEHAARAAQHDHRVRALAILTGYRPADDAEGEHLLSGAVEVLYVTSSDHRITTDAMRALYEASPGRRTRYIEYPGGAIGYQLFELDHELEPLIVDWLEEALAP